MPITELEKSGIIDLLVTEKQNIPVLMQLARSVTKNICEVQTVEQALEYVFVQLADTQLILSKRSVTKELLFKYLHQRRISANTDFTKSALVNKIVEYWNTGTAVSAETDSNTQQCDTHSALTCSTQQVTTPASTCTTETEDAAKQYPINLLARKFSEWFFSNYNDNKLKVEDFWTDARLLLRIVASDGSNDYESTGAEDIIDNLMRSKIQFGFYFNPNLTHAGVQGRMNVHGLVLVLCCGTLHTQDTCVGLFECIFGLLRDPFAESNWKVKTMQCTLRSQATPIMPSLFDLDTFGESLRLPVPQGELV